MLNEVWVDRLLDFSDLVDIFDTNSACTFMTWKRTALLQTRCFLDEVRSGRWLDSELEATIDVGFENDAHRDIRVELSRSIIEFLAELHHIDSERTESLTDLRRWFGTASDAVDPDGRLICWTLIR